MGGVNGSYCKDTRPAKSRAVALQGNLTQMLGLQLPTDPRWAQLAKCNLQALLTDHAYCEQKAASNAISLIVQFPEYAELVTEMASIAQEELAHFAAVHEKILERGWQLGHEQKDAYVNELYAFIRKGQGRDTLLLDRLLFAAMVEARSCERFRMLAETVADADLANFYHELMVSEANHYTIFLGFARQYAGRDTADARWKEWLSHESQVIQRYNAAPTMHG